MQEDVPVRYGQRQGSSSGYDSITLWIRIRVRKKRDTKYHIVFDKNSNFYN
jgi:hypothetical protein